MQCFQLVTLRRRTASLHSTVTVYSEKICGGARCGAIVQLDDVVVVYIPTVYTVRLD